MTCPNCGAQVRGTFCPICGAQVSQGQGNTGSARRRSSAGRKSGVPLTAIIAAVLVIAIAVGGGFLISNIADGPKKTLNTFAQGYNELDTEKMIGCLEPKTQRAIRGAGNLLDGLLGVDLDDVAALLPYFGNIAGILEGETGDEPAEMPKMKIKVNDKEKVSSEKVILYCTVELTMEDATSSYDAEFVMIKENKEWYISDESFGL